LTGKSRLKFPCDIGKIPFLQKNRLTGMDVMPITNAQVFGKRRRMKKNGSVRKSDYRAQDMTVKATSKKSAKSTIKMVSSGTVGKSGSSKKKFKLQEKLLIKIHNLMIKARVLEERMIKMYKQNDGYFWIGAPGEEAYQIPLGLLLDKGQGPEHDYLHLHYRCSGILVAMGLNPMDAIRQMKNVATDPFSGGRNFSNHYSVRKWNVVPVTSTIETQFATAIGTGIAQRQHGGKGLTIVTGGDAGTAEGEFTSSLVWSTKPNEELPMLIIVMDNGWGISTDRTTQHAEKYISDRGKPFGMKTRHFNGNDVEESYFALKEAMEYIRSERKPYFVDCLVSRLYGHSSASGANFNDEIEDPIVTFETQLLGAGVMTRKEMDQVREEYTVEMREMVKKVKQEPMPDPGSIFDYTYFGQRGKYW